MISSGQWAGMAILRSKVAPCDCGRWETTRDVLTLNYEDDMYSKFRYYVEGNSMTPDNRTWREPALESRVNRERMCGLVENLF